MWSLSCYTPARLAYYDALPSPCLLITTWQLVKAHGVTRNEPKIHVNSHYITLASPIPFLHYKLIFKLSTFVLNSEFSFSLVSGRYKANERSLSDYLHWTEGKTDKFIPFPKCRKKEIKKEDKLLIMKTCLTWLIHTHRHTHIQSERQRQRQKDRQTETLVVW